MLNQPYFNPSYRIETLEPETVFFLSERESVCLRNYLYYRLVSLIDGQRTIDEIIEILQLELLQTQSSLPESPNFFQEVLNISLKIQQALFNLEQQGYILEKKAQLPSELAIFCHHLNISPTIAYHQLQSIQVSVKALGSVSSEDFISILNSLHIQIADEGDLTVVLTDDYLHPQLNEFNQQALKSQSPWMPIKPLGTKLWIGPLFEPNKTGCWDCLAHRWRDNKPIEEFINRHTNHSIGVTPPLGFLTSTLHSALNMAATEVFKWIVQQKNPRLEGRLITYDTLTLQTQDHIVVKRPQCPSCGQFISSLHQKPLPVVLGHRKKTFTADGGHRYCSPEETLKKYQHQISPITGIVRELRKIPGNGLVHTYVATHHFRNIFDDLEGLRQNMGGRSAGKGRTDIQSQASGFCEAIERYSGVFQGDEIRKKASYEAMGEVAIHPNACLNFSQQQYQNREQWNAQCQGWFQKVPEPFDTEREIDWTPVWSLTAQDFKYLPTAYCYYGYPQSPPLDCWADSNGCAAGNTLEEAILQGFMELVERDCVALWWYNRLQKPQVNLDSFDQPYFQSLKDYYQSLNRDLWVLDITSDLNIPCFVAISRRTDREVEDILLGYGAHFDPQIAISRALTEVNQILPNILSAKDDGNVSTD